MQFHFHANLSRFHKNGFVLRLDLKQRHQETRKWSIQDRSAAVREMSRNGRQTRESGGNRAYIQDGGLNNVQIGISTGPAKTYLQARI